MALFGTPRKDRKDSQWPPEADTARLQYYDDGHALYRSQHRSVLNRRAGDGGYDAPTYQLYVVVNYLRRLTRLLVGRAFGEGIRVECAPDEAVTQSYLDHLYEANNGRQLHKRVGRGASYRGDAVLKTWFDADSQQVRIASVHPRVFYPEFDPLDETRLLAANLSQVVHSVNGSTYLWTERHERRENEAWITNSVWKLREASDGTYEYDSEDDRTELQAVPETENMLDEYPTGTVDLLVAHVTNETTEEGQPWGASFGISDYDALIGPQAAINDNYSGQRDVNRKFVRPILTGPDIRGEDGMARMEQMEFWAVENADDARFEVHTWDQNTAAVEQERRDLEDSIAMMGDVDPAALQTPESGGPISGKAIRMAQAQTQAAVRDKQDNHDGPIRAIYAAALQLAAAKRRERELAWEPDQETQAASASPDILPLAPDELSIAWTDGIPDDAMETIQEQSERLANGTQDPVAAIMLLDGLSEAEAEAKFAQIKERQPAQPQQSSPFGLGSMFSLEDEGVA